MFYDLTLEKSSFYVLNYHLHILTSNSSCKIFISFPHLVNILHCGNNNFILRVAKIGMPSGMIIPK